MRFPTITNYNLWPVSDKHRHFTNLIAPVGKLNPVYKAQARFSPSTIVNKATLNPARDIEKVGRPRPIGSTIDVYA